MRSMSMSKNILHLVIQLNKKQCKMKSIRISSGTKIQPTTNVSYCTDLLYSDLLYLEVHLMSQQ